MAGKRDNRQSVRNPFRISVRATINPPPGRETETVHICHVLAHDISDSGVSILLARRLTEGQQIELALPDRSRTAVVCRVAQVAGGKYLVGCRFEESDEVYSAAS